MSASDRLSTPIEGIQELDHWLPYQCSIITNRVSSMLKRMYADELGIGVTEWRLLANLAAHAPLSAKELAGHTAMDQVAITRAIAILVKKKLVTRREDAVDRRKVVLRLSKSGATAYESVSPLAR
ncbi:MAG TPA: MarR family winged helix-turn-helix transcriptional regulator, partial [Dokdonella sp.]